jgi:hypothetical protein
MLFINNVLKFEYQPGHLKLTFTFTFYYSDLTSDAIPVNFCLYSMILHFIIATLPTTFSMSCTLINTEVPFML